MGHSLVLATATLASLCGTAHAQAARPAGCEALLTLSLEATRVLAANDVPAGEMQQPAMGPYTPPPLQLPAHCAVRTVVTTSPKSQVSSDLWLPAPGAWNGKLLATGNGGYSSALSLPQMADGLRRGYAVAGSDTGHQGDSLSFGTGNEESMRDWAYRSTHVLATQLKAVSAAFYGKPASHAYFAGCSTGGQQALSEAQRFPADFDGIVAGDPGNDRILLNADFVESWKITHPIAGPAFPPAKLPMLTRAAIAACSTQDGLPEPYISDPTTCSFDPGTLACSSAANISSCLTPDELTMVRSLYAGALRDSAGKTIYPGWSVGSEAGWGSYLIMPTEPVRLEFWSSWVFNPSSFRLQSFNASAAVAAARAKLPFLEAVDPDLRLFAQRGGKLLMYHGWADPVVPPANTVGYFNRVGHVLGHATDNSVRLFMVPGMGHCGGGPGATAFDPVAALDAWVSTGAAPAHIVATHKGDGQPAFERPLCAFPQVARWDGLGDAAKASSFTCVEGSRK